MTTHVLERDPFPIMAWPGPGGKMIRDDTFAALAEAGFTVSYSTPRPQPEAVRQALDLAERHGLKLLLGHPSYCVGNDYVLSGEHKREIREFVESFSGHPAFYGYSLRDEPWFEHLSMLGEVEGWIRSLDDAHLVYVNHFPPIQGWGALTPEAFWRTYIACSRPRLLSFDHYPLTVADARTVESMRDRPNVFPEHKLVIKPDYFQCLDLLRNLSSLSGAPFWAFANAVPHGAYPAPTEGHLRFQLFHDLAYGAAGLQYFGYACNGGLIDKQGQTTPTWDIARRVNAELLRWGPLMKRLRNVGVFHNGPMWGGMRHLSTQSAHIIAGPAGAEEVRTYHMAVDVGGDQVTAAYFQDPDGVPYIMLVNVNPCDYAAVTLHLDLPENRRLVYRNPLIPDGSAEIRSGRLITIPAGDARLFAIEDVASGVSRQRRTIFL